MFRAESQAMQRISPRHAEALPTLQRRVGPC